LILLQRNTKVDHFTLCIAHITPSRRGWMTTTKIWACFKAETSMITSHHTIRAKLNYILMLLWSIIYKYKYKYKYKHIVNIIPIWTITGDDKWYLTNSNKLYSIAHLAKQLFLISLLTHFPTFDTPAVRHTVLIKHHHPVIDCLLKAGNKSEIVLLYSITCRCNSQVAPILCPFC